MNQVELVLRKISGDLAALRVPWAVVGGFAVSARAEPRFTRDVDAAVAVAGDAEAEAVIADLTARGYRLVAMTEQGLLALLDNADEADLDVAARSVGLIHDRGFGRGRDLAAALTMLRAAR